MKPEIGVVLAGKYYRLTLQYPGDLYYPSGPWYAIPDLVVYLKERQILRYRSKDPIKSWKISVGEYRKFRNAPDISHLRDNKKELEKIKNGKKKKV